jgi:hypothetical protein
MHARSTFFKVRCESFVAGTATRKGNMNRKLTMMLAALFILSIGLQANERKFTYVYESSVLPAGARELEVSNTYRSGKDYFFRALDQRLEFEFGVTDRLMSSLYLNGSSVTMDSNGTAAGGALTTDIAFSISNEWKYKLYDRVADPLGAALYGELTLGLDKTELEGKLILDKQIGSTLAAANIVVAHEWETLMNNGVAQTKTELELEFNAGVSIALSPAFSVGAEGFLRNLYSDGNLKHSALYLGPVVSYATENWWVTFTLIPQVTSFAGATNGSLNLDEFERVQGRLLLSFHL